MYIVLIVCVIVYNCIFFISNILMLCIITIKCHVGEVLSAPRRHSVWGFGAGEVMSGVFRPA